MISALKHLTSTEMELIYKAPILVSILIAGADGKIDRKEIEGAIRLAEKNTSAGGSEVSVLYQEIAQDFEDKLKILEQQYPYNAAQRNPLLVTELSQLNTLWPKVSSTFAHEFYQTLLNISHQIARSSGGMLGYKSVGSEEAQYVELTMVANPSAS
jgi:hypothetical protein